MSKGTNVLGELMSKGTNVLVCLLIFDLKLTGAHKTDFAVITIKRLSLAATMTQKTFAIVNDNFAR